MLCLSSNILILAALATYPSLTTISHRPSPPSKMRYQLGLVLVTGEEYRIVTSSRPFTSVRRYSEHLVSVAEPDLMFVEQIGTKHGIDLVENPKSELGSIGWNPAAQTKDGPHDAESQRGTSGKHDPNKAILKQLGYCSSQDVLELERLYHEELTARLHQIDERAASLRSEALHIENVYLYRAYANRASNLIQAYAVAREKPPASRLDSITKAIKTRMTLFKQRVYERHQERIVELAQRCESSRGMKKRVQLWLEHLQRDEQHGGILAFEHKDLVECLRLAVYQANGTRMLSRRSLQRELKEYSYRSDVQSTRQLDDAWKRRGHLDEGSDWLTLTRVKTM